ncbi:MAG: trypsin-like peptidase domain-containing protein [Rhodobacter sp.]|nr:trypsin-like peptidase domain-containing protein [Rhodobacter sp.]
MRALLILLAVSLAAPATAETRVPSGEAEIRLSYAPVVKAVTPSVVNIYAKRVVEARVSPFANDPFFSQFFNLQSRPRVQNSLGSGVILAEDGIVVSNFHVVGNATDIRVVLADRREFDAEMLLADPDTDLAILQLRGAPDLPALDFADSDRVEVGDLVLAVGNPFGVGQTVSSGIISASARSGQVGGRPGYFIQTDAPINPGNSGGALVDMAGRLVGINTAIVTRSGGSDGIGFAIPANLVKQYVAQAAAGKKDLVRPWAGITVQTVDGPLAEALGLDLPQGVLISALHPQSPFAEGGLEIGDVVTAIAGLPVDGGPEMLFRLLTLGIGTEAETAFLRDGAPLTAMVRLAPPPDVPPRDEIRIEARSILNGLSAANVNPVVIQKLHLPLEAQGVVVTRVEDISIRTRLRPGDLIRRINGQAIEDTGDLRRIARERVSGYEIEFERGGQRGIVRLRN